MKRGKTYSEIFKELEGIVEKMDKGDVPIDELGDTVKKAVNMLKSLKKRLKTTEMEITEIFKEIEDGEAGKDTEKV